MKLSTMGPGRKAPKRKIYYIKKYNLPCNTRTPRYLSMRLVDQLDACADESARRVLLGIGRPR